MSDTPETDAAWDKYISPPYTYWAGDLRILAQRLERERDEARHKLELCMAANSDVARIAKERDEAQAELEMWRDGNIMHQIHRDELEKAERERDEAREALREAWLAMDEVDGTDRMVNWQNKNANILEGAK
jgi:hypothetical protein